MDSTRIRLVRKSGSRSIELLANLAIKHDLEVTDNWFKLVLRDPQSRPLMYFFAFRGEILTPYHLRQIQVVTDIVFLVETRSENIKAIQKSKYKKSLIASEQLEYIWSGAWNPLKHPKTNFSRLCSSIYWFKPHRVSRDIEDKNADILRKNTIKSFIQRVLDNWILFCPVVTLLGPTLLGDWYETNKGQLLATILAIAYVIPATITAMLVGGLLWEALRAIYERLVYEPLYKALYRLKINQLKHIEPPSDFNEIWGWEFEIECRAEQAAKTLVTGILLIASMLLLGLVLVSLLIE